MHSDRIIMLVWEQDLFCIRKKCCRQFPLDSPAWLTKDWYTEHKVKDLKEQGEETLMIP